MCANCTAEDEGHLRDPGKVKPDVPLVRTNHRADFDGVAVEHPGVEPVLPVLVLDGRLRELARGVHVPHVRRVLPDILHHYRARGGVDVPHGRDRGAHVLVFVRVRAHVVSLQLSLLFPPLIFRGSQ